MSKNTIFFLLANILLIAILVLNIKWFSIVGIIFLPVSFFLGVINFICLLFFVLMQKSLDNKTKLVNVFFVLAVASSIISFFTNSMMFDKADLNIQIIYFEQVVSLISSIYALLFPIFAFSTIFYKSANKKV